MNRESFSKERTIGEGGCGIVEVVWHPDYETGIARKRLNDLARWGPERERNIKRFETEVTLLRERLDHPNVIKILDADLDGDDPWFFMPLAPQNLAEIVPNGGLPDDQVRDQFGQILGAMQHAHARGVLHRDVKAHNILMIDGRPIVADFGLGRDADSDKTRITTSTYMGGTAGYIAPEQQRRFADSDRRSDVFSLGSLLYFMVTGRSPEYLELDLARAQYRRVIRRCREFDPDQRYQSVAELREAFDQLWEEPDAELPRVQQARALIEQAGNSGPARGELVTLYLRHQDDLDLFASTLPEWSSELIAAQAVAGPREFGELVAAYCDLLPGNMDFGHLDVAAQFMGRIFRDTDDPLLRELILRRMLRMAMDNNRWAVGRTFVGLVRGLQLPHDRSLAHEILSADPDSIRWLVANASGARDVPIINAIWQRLEGTEPAGAESVPPQPAAVSDAVRDVMEGQPPNRSRKPTRAHIRDQALHFLYDRYEVFGSHPHQISKKEMDQAVIRLGVPEPDLRTAFRELVEDGLAEGSSRPGTEMVPEDGLVWISPEGRHRIEALPPNARFSQQLREQARLVRTDRQRLEQDDAPDRNNSQSHQPTGSAIDDQDQTYRADLSKTDVAALSALATEFRENLELLKEPHVSRRSWVLLRRTALDTAAVSLSRLPADVGASFTAAAVKLERYNAAAQSINTSNHSGPTLHTLEKDQLQPRIAETRSALEEAIESLDPWIRKQQNRT